MKPLSPHQRLSNARDRANLARLRFVTALDGTRKRVSPARLKDDALLAINDKIDDAKNDARQALRRHPVVTVSAVAGGAAILFWAPARHLALYAARVGQFIWLNRKLWTPKKSVETKE